MYLHCAEDDDNNSDEYYIFSPSKFTADRNSSKVDSDDANHDDGNNLCYDYLKLVPAVSINYPSNQDYSCLDNQKLCIPSIRTGNSLVESSAIKGKSRYTYTGVHA